jgi:hypothetical protein
MSLSFACQRIVSSNAKKAVKAMNGGQLRTIVNLKGCVVNSHNEFDPLVRRICCTVVVL